jgi:hypothetical protein
MARDAEEGIPKVCRDDLKLKPAHMSTTQRTSFPKAEFFSALTASGMPSAAEFSVVPWRK